MVSSISVRPSTMQKKASGKTGGFLLPTISIFSGAFTETKGFVLRLPNPYRDFARSCPKPD